MRLHRFSLQNLFALGDRFSLVGGAARRLCSIFFKSNASLPSFFAFNLTILATTLFLTALVGGGGAFAQQAAPSASASNAAQVPQSGPATPEEVGGTTVRDFDATRALGDDYLENPDGGEIPLDEDDVWFPELALGEKSPNAATTRVRSISFADGKARTETVEIAPRNLSAAQNSQIAQNVQAPQTAASESGVAPGASGFQNFQNYRPSSNAAPISSAVSALNAEPIASSVSAPSSVGFADYRPSVPGFQNYQPTTPSAPSSAADSTLPSIPVPTADPLAPPTESTPISDPIDALISSPLAVPTSPAPNAAVDAAPILPPSASADRLETFETELFDPSAPSTLPNPQEMSLDEAKLSKSDVDKLIVEDVRVSGLEMTTQQFNQIIQTRIGRPFNQQRLEEDKRALLQTRQFVDVAVSTTWRPDKPEKVVVNFDLIPRRMMKYIKIVGCKRIARLDILDELGVTPGETRMDPYEVENGRIRIIELYKSKNYPEPHVEILSGDRPEDIGVVYLINEGRKQRVLKTTFVGNKIASAARLKSLVSVKPGVLYLIGGEFNRDRLDEDVSLLLDYYRKLGFFDARVDREYEEGEGYTGFGRDNAWISVKYIIDEGPRYKIRNFFFEGNRVLSKEELEKELKVASGSFYNYHALEEDRIALRYKYQDLGYVRADVTPTPLFTEEEGVLDIRFAISEDHRYRVRDVIVDYVGTESRTKKSVVWNLLDLSPGELLNGRKIRSSENALQRSGYFNDKPNEGQLPEIAVVPDESRSFRVQKEDDGTQTVKEARRFDDGDSSKNGDDKNENGSENSNGSDGSSRRFGSVDRTPTVYRAAYPPTNERNEIANADRNGASFGYVPYDEAVKNVESDANATFATSGAPAFRSYSPSATFAPTTETRSSTPTLVRGQARQIPAGFSNETTRFDGSATASGGSGYSPYRSEDAPSQYSGGVGYANYDSSDLNAPQYGATLTTDAADANAPGFSDGVYSSIGKELDEPITSPENDEIYDGDVLVKIQEGRTGMFTASIGVNSDYGLMGNVSFEERNFDLLRFPTSFWRLDGWRDAFRGGGQIFKAQASPGTEVQRYSVSWDVPYVFNTKNTFGVTGLYGDRSYDEWFETRYGGELRLGRQWSNRFSTTLSGGAYKVKISQPAVNFVPDLTEAVGSHNMFTVGLTGTYDERNHPFSPSEGYLVRGSIEQVLGSYQFPRASLDGRYYKTLHQRVDNSGRWVLGLSSHVGWSGDDAPIFERYYGGGSMNLRGFEYRGVTPRYGNTGFGVGGNFEFYNTAELLIPLSGGDEFKFALFVDSGTVAKSIDDWGKYRVSPGFGFRLSIPMLGPAPLALDFAFPVAKSGEDITEVFSFSMSGSR